MSNRRRGSINLEECETILSNLDSSHYNHLFSIKTKARDKVKVIDFRFQFFHLGIFSLISQVTYCNRTTTHSGPAISSSAHLISSFYHR